MRRGYFFCSLEGDGCAFCSPFVAAPLSGATACVEADGEAAFCGVVEVAGDVCGDTDGAGVAVIGGALCVSRTERVPKSGSDKTKPIIINAAAAIMVILDSRVAVPRGPNAVLETALVNSAPASALPGWSKIETISTTHANRNNV